MAKNDKTLVKKTIYNKVIKKVIYEMCECCDEILNGNTLQGMSADVSFSAKNV